jgi:SPP1 gp7 family putative phage head morphogenesis protein
MNSARTLAMIRFLGATKPRRKRMPKQLPPRPIELAYYREIQRSGLGRMVKILYQAIPSIVRQTMLARGEGFRADALTDAAREAVRKMVDAFKPARLEAAAKRFAERTDDWNKKELGKQVSAAMSVPLEKLELRTQNRVPAFVAENVSLIKTIPERATERVEKLVSEALETGMRPETLAERLQEAADVSESDAMRIARDQIGKLNAQVNEDRQRALGVKRAIWRTVGDNRVRDEHEALDGQEFDLDTGIDGIWPGSEIQCRCFSEPVFDFLNEDT